MTAPTEQEIRDLLEARIAQYPSDSGESNLSESIEQFFDLIDYKVETDSATDEAIEYGNDVWTDLRPSHGRRLQQLATEGRERAYEQARTLIIEGVVAAALRFAAEYPDAERQKVPVPA